MPLPPRPPPPALGVVIPAWNEAGRVGAAVASALAAGADDVVVADGGSEDATAVEAGEAGARVVVAPRGRASQMNAGAAAARGDVLLFLHADGRLTPGASARVRRTLRDPRVVGGRFDVRLDRGGLLLRTVEGLMNWRSRHTGIATGDQAIFVRRDVFDRLGGYEAIPLFEDVRLSRRLRRAGRFVPVRDRVAASARRWIEAGTWRTILLMWRLRAAHANGADPFGLAARYRRTSKKRGSP